GLGGGAAEAAARGRGGADGRAGAGGLAAPPPRVVAGEPQGVPDEVAPGQPLDAAPQVVAEVPHREPAQRGRGPERIGEVIDAGAQHARGERAAERRGAEAVGVAAAVEEEPARAGGQARGGLDRREARRLRDDHSSTFMRRAFSSAARTKNRTYSPADHTDMTSEM